MIGLLQKILCVLKNVLLVAAYAGVELVNLLVKALGLLAVGLLALLPEMPAVPDPPDEGVLAWLSWLYPLPALLSVFAAGITIFATILLVRIGLRWVKAL